MDGDGEMDGLRQDRSTPEEGSFSSSARGTIVSLGRPDPDGGSRCSLRSFTPTSHILTIDTSCESCVYLLKEKGKEKGRKRAFGVTACMCRLSSCYRKLVICLIYSMASKLRVQTKQLSLVIKISNPLRKKKKKKKSCATHMPTKAIVLYRGFISLIIYFRHDIGKVTFGFLLKASSKMHPPLSLSVYGRSIATAKIQIKLCSVCLVADIQHRFVL